MGAVFLPVLDRRLRGVALLLGCLLMGCVRVEANREPPQATRLIVTRDQNGVNMQFQSEADLHYTIYYRDTGVPNDTWKQLPNATELPGTGELILIHDPDPAAFRRKYRIQSLIPVSRAELQKRKKP